MENKKNEHLIIEEKGAVDWVILNRPDSLNALNLEMVTALRDYFRGMATRPERRIIVLRGAGRAFCAGLDLKEEETQDLNSPQQGLAFQRSIAEIYIAMRRCPQPIISLISGAACGGGLSLALASDIRIADTTAKMNCAYIRIGLSGCDMGSSYFLPRLVGASLAAELILTGKFILAQRALDIGLVSQVVELGQLENAVEEDLKLMLSNSPLGLRLSKEALNVNIDTASLEAAIALEDRNQILCSLTEDSKEGLVAFTERRAPHYRDI
ncbi:putative enoyl-CoA hydratase echA12 [Zhongshania aliphaticivorans]|uniref:Putative enoyl-CoA hydratase echA12 n=1 Tax=Zhongshania aliphaticivorans TaxID=1470434 RepID=A0A5S9NS85_9GAMM|nr:enoyl-CoA hydratase-related protein [Zhongshania aliphaticivorans]CAA0093387.1 putative enoyl-CoA hydratase echA12 [Zhongshania aliphaticivorans]CAA0111256.1 putative enoyl-CoA hydratase echA12 [Zhongshania aliphaticivorans]